jgi:hypothetical protein
MCLANSEAAVEGAIADIEGIVKKAKNLTAPLLKLLKPIVDKLKNRVKNRREKRKGKKASAADYAGKYF